MKIKEWWDMQVTMFMVMTALAIMFCVLWGLEVGSKPEPPYFPSPGYQEHKRANEEVYEIVVDFMFTDIEDAYEFFVYMEELKDES